jgi:hypothetical protein
MKTKKIFLLAVLGAGVVACGVIMSACFPDMVVVEPPSLSLDDDPTGYDDWLGSPAAWGSGDLIVDLPRSYGTPSEPVGASLEELRALRESINRAERAKEAAAGSDRSPRPRESDEHR